MALTYILVNGVYVAVNQTTAGGQTVNMEAINFADPSGTCASISAAGSVGTNALTVQGNASGVPIPVATGATTDAILTPTILSATSSTAVDYIKSSAGLVGRLINTSTSALPSTVQLVILDQGSGTAVAANTIYQIAGMAAGQVIDLSIPTANGIGVYLAGGSLTTNIVLTYR